MTIYNLVIAFDDETISCVPYSTLEIAKTNMDMIQYVYDDYTWAVITKSEIDKPLLLPTEIN